MKNQKNNLKYKLDFPLILHEEGSTSFYIPDLNHYKGEASEYLPAKLPVFFNPTMEFRRDITILAIKAFKSNSDRDFTFCDPLAATGAMGIRVANEIEGSKVYINDINEKAVNLAKKSIHYNNLKNITVSNDFANDFMIKNIGQVKRFDVIDVDPFGTPVPFLDAALYSIRSGGLICCTATDMMPLVGVKQHLQSCIRNYGSVPLRTEYAHETALRILIGFIVRQAAKYENAARMVFSHSSNHYIQVFFKIEHGILLANQCLTDLGYIGHCVKCQNRTFYNGLIPEFIRECKNCSGKLEFAGPLWLGNLSETEFCQKMLKNLETIELNTKNRIQKLLDLVIQEVGGPITFHDVHKIGKKRHLSIPPMENIISSLRKDNFVANKTHFSPTAIKTDASREKIAKIIQELQE